MAVAALFHYSPGQSFLHGMDPRYKLLLMLMIVPAAFLSSLPGLIVVGLWLLCTEIVFHRSAGHTADFGRRLRESRFLFILVLVLFLFRSFEDGSQADWGAGAVAAARFVCVLMFSQLFVRSTDPVEIQDALYALLKWIHPAAAQRIAVRIGLMIMFLPLLLDKAAQIREAGIARNLLRRRNPLMRIKAFAVPLLFAAVETADTTSDALESRCFTGEYASNVEFSGRAKLFFIISIALFLGVVFIGLLSDA